MKTQTFHVKQQPNPNWSPTGSVDRHAYSVIKTENSIEIAIGDVLTKADVDALCKARDTKVVVTK